MYKVIIDDVIVYSTDEIYKYVDYLIENGWIYQLVRDTIPLNYEIKADDHEDDCELIDLETSKKLMKRVWYSAN
jgi:hypothetical protein